MGHSFPQASKGKMSYAFLRDLWLQKKKAFLSYPHCFYWRYRSAKSREWDLPERDFLSIAFIRAPPPKTNNDRLFWLSANMDLQRKWNKDTENDMDSTQKIHESTYETPQKYDVVRAIGICCGTFFKPHPSFIAAATNTTACILTCLAHSSLTQRPDNDRLERESQTTEREKERECTVQYGKEKKPAIGSI